MGYLHDPANVQQTSSKGIQNTRAGRLLKFAGRLLSYVIMELDVCWIVSTPYYFTRLFVTILTWESVMQLPVTRVVESKWF